MIRSGWRFTGVIAPLALAMLYIVLDSGDVRDPNSIVRVRQVRKYRDQINRLQYLLTDLNRQVDSSGNGYIIQNSLLELRQEWLLTDVIAGTTHDQRITTHHPSSDGLRTLYSLCFPVYESINQKAALQEIRQLKKRVDIVN